MRIVADTNTLVSGILFNGPPRRVVDAIKLGTWQNCSSDTLLAELLDVLSRRKFSARLRRAGLTAGGIVSDLRRLADIVVPPHLPPIVLRDPDDDHVLACAIAAGADLIVSGDRDLLDLNSFQGIQILRPAAAARMLAIP